MTTEVPRPGTAAVTSTWGRYRCGPLFRTCKHRGGSLLDAPIGRGRAMGGDRQREAGEAQSLFDGWSGLTRRIAPRDLVPRSELNRRLPLSASISLSNDNNK